MPERPLRVVAVEALAGGREVFYPTCVGASPEQVLTWYALRWSVEVTFRDCKRHLGFEEPQGWAWPSTTPCPGVWRRFAIASRTWPKRFARSLEKFAECARTTWEAGGAES